MIEKICHVVEIWTWHIEDATWTFFGFVFILQGLAWDHLQTSFSGGLESISRLFQFSVPTFFNFDAGSLILMHHKSSKSKGWQLRGGEIYARLGIYIKILIGCEIFWTKILIPALYRVCDNDIMRMGTIV